MIKLTVQHYNGEPLRQALVGQFDEMGGTIGRADNNLLVLPDPERTISRVHAQIVFRHGTYSVIDRGSNPIQHNGRVLGNGQEAALALGDQLEIGGYLIRVEQASAPHHTTGIAATANDPFADFAGVTFAASATAPQANGVSESSHLDPLAAFGFSSSASAFDAGGAAGTTRPWALPPTLPPALPAAGLAPIGGGIPADWNPFAPVPVPEPTPDAAQPAGFVPDPLRPNMGQIHSGAAASLDAMFGLADTVQGDPLAQSHLSPPIFEPNTASHADPLQSLLGIPASFEAPIADHVSALHEPFFAVTPPVASSSVAPQTIEPKAAAAQGGQPVFSWNDGAQDGHTVIRAKSKPVSAVPDALADGQLPHPPTEAASVSMVTTPATSGAAQPSQQPKQELQATQQAVLATDKSPMQSSNEGQASLLAALADGLGVPLPPGQELTPEFMRLLGTMLRDATQGTVDLLVARAALKREVRAEVTMIAAKENNPLKFSPSAEVALNHLLSPTMRGFMPASQAMHDAYCDLRAHQFAFVAGMRAALEGVLQRFDPAQLESKLAQKSGISGLLAGSRKARMWELFVQLYGNISAEASDDFHELFGKEFVRAYEAHIDQLQSEQ